MEINEIKHGFKLISIEEANDIKSTLYVYEHLVSGGKVMYLKNDDTNCVCAFGFRTIPEDSTGVCHIIEHSTLCGSKKYPLKEPFVNLIKGSLNTFLNAFTAADWTMYPFASQTPKDFDNILKIYADAVFAPLSVIDNKPFLQEGWHLELLEKDGVPSYKGVVYNEMKGAMSDVSRILYQTTLEAMYKDTSYAFNSGGDPDVIPELTYEAYKDFYNRHYTPQNCMTYFYGDLDIEEKLKFLDEEYFSKYKKSDKEIKVKAQTPLINTNYVKEYGIGEDEDTKDNTYISLCYGLDNYNNHEEFLAMNILFDALMSGNETPLKKALLDAKLGQDIDCSFEDDNIIPSLHIQLAKTNPNKKDALRKTFEEEVRKLVNNGIDKDLLLAAINHSEFTLKECDMGRMPKGIVYAMNMMGSFDYNGDLLSHLTYSKHFKKFKEELNNGYFEKLLEKYILNSKHFVEAMITPSKTLNAKKKALMDEKMNKLKETMSEEEKEFLVKQTKELIAYQNHVDTKKELATLPSLKLKDIPMKVNYLDSKRTRVNGMSGIKHIIDTNEIGYLRMYFNLNKLTEEELYYAFLLKSLLLNVPTKNYETLKLNSKIKTYLGDFDFQEQVYAVTNTECKSFFRVSVSALDENIKYMPEFINEVLVNSKFTKKEIKTIIAQLIITSKQAIMGNGMAIAMLTSRSSMSKDNAMLMYTTTNPNTYKSLCDLQENFDFEKLNKKLKLVAKKLFNKKNCFYSISGNEHTLEALNEALREVKLPSKKYEDVLDLKVKQPLNDALVIQSGVSYNSMANSYKKLGFEYSGKHLVVSHLVNYDFLWNEVRVKGGAYGCSVVIFRASGVVTMGSYRDPNVNSTYETFNKIGEYLRTFKVSKNELNSYIIGAMGSFDSPQSTPATISEGDTVYFTGFTKKAKIALKKSVIKTTLEDINETSLLFNKLAENASYYTIGNEAKIKEHNFDKVENLK